MARSRVHDPEPKDLSSQPIVKPTWLDAPIPWEIEKKISTATAGYPN